MKRAMQLAALFPACLAWLGSAAAADDTLVYIGTRPPATAQSPQQLAPYGIYAGRIDRRGHLTSLGQQVQLARTTALVPHPARPVLYSVAQAAAGAAADSNLHSFAVDVATGRLTGINAVASGGRDTTALALDSASGTLFGGSFLSGDVTVAPLHADGSVGAMVSSQKQTGSGPHPRQNASHVHGVALDPSRRWVLSTDFGADRIFVYRFDGAARALLPAPTPSETLPPGSGPRHLVFHPNGRLLFVNAELTAEVLTYRWDAMHGRLTLLSSQSAYPEGHAGNGRSSSDIALSANGKFLYVGLRGDQNSVVAYRIDRRTDQPVETQRISSQGSSPWALAIDPSGRWLLVANEASNSVNVLAIDRTSGTLSATGQSLPVPNPAALAFHDR